MEEPPSYEPIPAIRDLLKQLVDRLNQLSPEQFVAMVKPSFDTSNPVSAVYDCFTWIGPEECLSPLFQHIVLKEEILEEISEERFLTLFLSKNLPETRVRIAYHKMSDLIYLLKSFREQEPRLIAKDSYLHNQLWLLFDDHQGKRLDLGSLRRMVSRGGVRSAKRRKELDLIIEIVNLEYRRNRRK